MMFREKVDSVNFRFGSLELNVAYVEQGEGELQYDAFFVSDIQINSYFKKPKKKYFKV